MTLTGYASDDPAPCAERQGGEELGGVGCKPLVDDKGYGQQYQKVGEACREAAEKSLLSETFAHEKSGESTGEKVDGIYCHFYLRFL